MDTDWTSLISKQQRRLSFISIFSFLLILALSNGCARTEKLAKIEYKTDKPKKLPVFIPGPQLPKQQKLLKDMTDKYGLGGLTATHFYAVHLNADKYVDLVILPDFYSIPQFFIFSPELQKFQPMKETPFKEVTKASFLEFGDFNRDNIIDVLVMTLNQRSALRPRPPKLYIGKYDKNLNIQFEKHPYEFPVDAFSSVISFDFNNDKILDLYLGNWFDVRQSPARIRPNRLYIGVKSKEKGEYGFSFKEASANFVGEWDYNKDLKNFPNASPTFGLGLCDLNFDGRAEIINANTTGYKNKMWSMSMVEGKLSFRDLAKGTVLANDQIGKHLPQGGGHTFYLNCHDYNQDGFFDVSVGELFHSYDLDIKDRSSILTGANAGPKFEFIRTEYHQDDGTESWDQGDRRSLWLDIDGNGLSDLLIDNSGFPPKSRMVLFWQDTDHSYMDIAKDWGIDHMNPAGTIYLDLNNDGDLDLVSGQTNIRDTRIKNRIYLLENKMKRKGQLLKLHFDSYSRGQSFEVLKKSGVKQKFILETSNGPQASQSESSVYIYAGTGRFESITIPQFGGPSQVFKLSPFRKSNEVQLYFCDRKVQKHRCHHQ